MAFSLEELTKQEPYSLSGPEKAALYREALSQLTQLHYQGCPQYRRMLDVLGYDPHVPRGQEEQPYLPVRLFKEYDLLSVPREEIAKTMTSSGTSGQAVSKIYLSKENVRSQTKVLAEILSDYLGKKRLPLIILDTEMVKKDRTMFSARGAGIIGFSTFGRDILYALDGEMRLDLPKLRAFLEQHRGETILLFGYTYMIWQYVAQVLRQEEQHLGIEKGILFHIGGWKKLKDQAVDAPTYNKILREWLGNITVHNYYGMAEQLGSVFVECECGHLHCSNYSDVLIRRPGDFSLAGVGEKGLIQLQSLLPTSYPGHSLLTEDEGEVLGEDDCPCGRKGKYFKIHGRVKGAELRGCSDTYERR